MYSGFLIIKKVNSLALGEGCKEIFVVIELFGFISKK
ncbi:hypothetical protein protein [Bacillus cereus G9241]|nr:hypothetical protein protein [Bacillus cereus G9241]